jgi:hypothetical protein
VVEALSTHFGGQEAHPGDVVGFILRLYECPDGYRVHELLWS